MPDASSINNWIPVIGTLSGAAVGLLASFLIAYFNKSSDERKAKSDRERSRIERLYELLISIKMEHGKELAGVLIWIHNATPIASDEVSGIPPLVELNMLINLYFPDLKVEQEELTGAIQKYGKALLEARQTDYRKKTLTEKQIASGSMFNMHGVIGHKITSMQERLEKRVKP